MAKRGNMAAKEKELVKMLKNTCIISVPPEKQKLWEGRGFKVVETKEKK